MTNHFVATSKYFPAQDELLQRELIDSYISLAQAINEREVSIYQEPEFNTGQTYYQSSSQTNRNVFRKVVFFTGLSTGANTVAHSISFPSPNTLVFSHIYGMIYSISAPLYVPIPNDTILVTLDATNVNITIPVAYNGFDGQVVLEYMKTL